jgi:arginase
MICFMVRRLVVVGAPSSAGSYAPGQEAAPAVLRELGLIERLADGGGDVRDAGDGPLQVWAPDREHSRAQNLDAVVLSVNAVAEQVGVALDEQADVLVVGGNCTVALGVMDALLQRDRDAGLLYIDRHFDLNTPASTSDGALDWMGLAHGLDLPDAADALASAFHQRPLLRPDQFYLLGVDESVATDWEREQAHRLNVRWCSHTARRQSISGSLHRGTQPGPSRRRPANTARLRVRPADSIRLTDQFARTNAGLSRNRRPVRLGRRSSTRRT